MTTEASLRTLLDKTQVAYVACWRVLAGIKEMSTSPTFLQDLLEFQPTLAEALYTLDQADRALEQGRDDLVAQKAALPRDNFLREIKRLGKYQEAVREATRMGKTLGDAFAWFFYQDELKYLHKHLEHEPVTEFPTGIGHDGEIAFINNMKVIDGHLVLYHGITTILRHGDVSLIDLNTFRVVCLGELKSHRDKPGELTITAHFVGPRDCSLPPSLMNAPRSVEPQRTLPPEMAERFQRQMKGMAASFKPIPVAEHLNVVQDTYYPSLMKIAERLNDSMVVYEQCGDGLLLIGHRTDESNALFDKLLSTTTIRAMNELQEIKPHVARLIDKNQPSDSLNANRIVIGVLGRGLLPGATPPCWWPVNASFLEKLFFQHVTVVTIYNPAHLVRKLRGQGFEVQPIGRDRFDVHKRVGEVRMTIQGFDYFQRLVRDHLIAEEAVVSIMSQINSIVESGKVGPNTRMPLYITQPFKPHS